MAHGTRRVYPDEQNKGQSSIFQPPEDGRGVQWPKRCDKHGDKDEDNSPKNVNNVQFFLLSAFLLSIEVKLNWRPEGSLFNSYYTKV